MSTCNVLFNGPIKGLHLPLEVVPTALIEIFLEQIACQIDRGTSRLWVSIKIDVDWCVGRRFARCKACCESASQSGLDRTQYWATRVFERLSRDHKPSIQKSLHWIERFKLPALATVRPDTVLLFTEVCLQLWTLASVSAQKRTQNVLSGSRVASCSSISMVPCLRPQRMYSLAGRSASMNTDAALHMWYLVIKHVFQMDVAPSGKWQQSKRSCLCHDQATASGLGRVFGSRGCDERLKRDKVGPSPRYCAVKPGPSYECCDQSNKLHL